MSCGDLIPVFTTRTCQGYVVRLQAAGGINDPKLRLSGSLTLHTIGSCLSLLSMNTRSSLPWIVVLAVLVAGMLGGYHFIPRATTTMEFPRHVVTRAYCKTLLREPHAELSQVKIKPVPGTDLFEVTASGFTRDEAKQRRDEATGFLNDQSRAFYDKRWDEEYRRSTLGKTPEEQFAEIYKMRSKGFGAYSGNWTIHAVEESGW